MLKKRLRAKLIDLLEWCLFVVIVLMGASFVGMYLKWFLEFLWEM